MSHLTPAAVRQQIAAGSPEPLYLVTGDDEAEMSGIGTALADSVDEDFRAFNVQRFYGTDKGANLAAAFDAAGTLPWLGARRIVLVLQAQKLLSKRGAADAEPATVDPAAEPAADDSSGGPAGQLALLKAYAKHPHPHAVVALFGRGLLKSFDALAGQAAVVACEMTFDAVHEVEAAFSVRFDRQAAELLRQTVGADVTRLRAEAEKIALYATGRATITRELVSEVMNRASATDNLWKLVANRRLADALRELQLELAEGAKPGIHFMILGLLRSVVERTVAPRDLPGAFDALLRTDLALKTSGGDPRVLLERLIVELCATGRD